MITRVSLPIRVQSRAKKKSRITFVSQLRIAIWLIGTIFVCSPNLAKTATSHIAKYPLPTILTETYWPGIGTLHSAVQTSPSASCRTWSPHIGFCLWSFRIPTRTSKFDNGLEKLPEKKVIYERREVLAVQQVQEDIFDIEILRWKSSRTGDCKQHVAICALVCSICSHFVTRDFRVAPGWKAFLDFFAGFVLMANHRECVGQSRLLQRKFFIRHWFTSDWEGSKVSLLLRLKTEQGDNQQNP